MAREEFFHLPIVKCPHRRKRWKTWIAYRVDVEFRGNVFDFDIPANYETDLATVPPCFWSIISPFDLSIVAPVLHDMLYCSPELSDRKFSRYEADRFFLSLMKEAGISTMKRYAAYYSVRSLGWFFWWKVRSGVRSQESGGQ